MVFDTLRFLAELGGYGAMWVGFMIAFRSLTVGSVDVVKKDMPFSIFITLLGLFIVWKVH